MLPSTVRIKARIREDTVHNVMRYRGAPREAIERRLRHLEREWDVERALQAHAAATALAGLALGAFVHRRFLLLPAAMGAFLLQHAVQGWCPPLPLFRRLGFRTRSEIQAERRVLARLRPRPV
ncbi:MAG TPA: YgaP-like transmembrane domain [Burkholderiales bacterium]|nr:YgaP-like transmembrane domain [Burkholderiales bacterium]